MRRCHRCPFHLGENWNKTIQAKDASKPSEAQQSMAATNKCADSRQLAHRRNRGGGSAAYPFRHPSIRTAANDPTEEHLVKEIAGILWRKRRLRSLSARNWRDHRSCASVRRACAASQRSVRKHPPAEVISALDAWFDRIAGAVHTFGGESLQIHRRRHAGDLSGRRGVAPQRLRRSAQGGRRRSGRNGAPGRGAAEDGLPPLPFGVALHLGEMFWGNIGAADLRLHRHRPRRQSGQPAAGACRPLDRRSCLRQVRRRDRPYR